MIDFRSISKKNHSSYKFLFNKKFKNKRLNLNDNRVVYPRHGVYGVKVMENCELQLFQFRSLHLALLPICKGLVRFWFFVAFLWPLTAKPSQRMGTGKGKVSHWVTKLVRGDIILEFSLPDERLRRKIFKLLYVKFPVKIKILKRYDI